MIINILLFIAAVIFLLLIFKNRKQGPVYPRLKVGDYAPDFVLKDEKGNAYSLLDYRGKKLVLYFYPKDFTPSCTTEACSFRDSFDIYKEHNIYILGINYDTPESHRRFKEQHRLPYPLLSDTTQEVSKKYGAYKNIGNALFPERITYLIDENGKIIYIYNQVTVEGHAYDILERFKAHASPIEHKE